MRRALACFIIFTAVTWLAFAQRYSAPGQIVGSSHDFSATNANQPYAALSETQRCVFCHTPHNANPKAPLWNHALSGATYQVYGSSTLTASVGQPLSTDSSKLCLGCHDGTVALGNTVNNGTIPIKNGTTTIPTTDVNNLGVDLSVSHPVAFTPVYPTPPAYPQVALPPPTDPVSLDAPPPGGRVQCTSCHTPHEQKRDTTEARFLVKNNSGASICSTCHNPRSISSATYLWSWNGSVGQQTSHATALNAYTSDTNDGISYLGSHTGYTTTQTNGCEACHRPHTAHDAQRLLKGDMDTVCFQCHDGNATTNIVFPPPNQTTRQNISAAFSSKTYKHPATGTPANSGSSQAGHDANETPLNGSGNNTVRHAACADCHNPHAAQGDGISDPVPPALSKTLVGASGINKSQVALDPLRGSGEVSQQYEICFKCHGDSPNKPQTPDLSSSGIGYGVLALRMWDFQTNGNPSDVNWTTPLPTRANLREQFTNHASYPSYHPVVDARNLSLAQVPTLRPYVLDASGNNILSRPLGPSSIIYCSDCHSDDTGRQLGTGNTDPKGPHGSNQPHLLERSLAIGPQSIPMMEMEGGAGAQPLCAKCHDYSKHLPGAPVDGISAHNVSCEVCHDPHASKSIYLVNWDHWTVDGPCTTGSMMGTSGSGGKFYLDASYSTPGKGLCYLKCHMNHCPLPFPAEGM